MLTNGFTSTREVYRYSSAWQIICGKQFVSRPSLFTNKKVSPQRCIQSAALRPGTHSFFFWTQRILNEGSNWTQKKKKSNVYANHKVKEKTASHDAQICVSWKQFLSTGWLFSHGLFRSFRLKPKSHCVFSSVLSFVCYVWISTCCVTLSELFFGGTNRRHCRSANNNLPFQSILSFFACCPSEFQALVSLW